MKSFICPICNKDMNRHEQFCCNAQPVMESHPIAEFLESVHIIVRIVALVLFIVLVAFVSSAWAGGGYFEAPVVNGYCRPFMEPPKPWKRLYSFDELKIMQGKIKVKEIKKFQVNHCFEYDEVERGKIIREYVIAEEWYR